MNESCFNCPSKLYCFGYQTSSYFAFKYVKSRMLNKNPIRHAGWFVLTQEGNFLGCTTSLEPFSTMPDQLSGLQAHNVVCFHL